MRANERHLLAAALVLAIVAPWFAAAGDDARPAPPELLRIVAYNTENYLVDGDEPKSESARRAVIDVLAALRPDIVSLVEVGGEAAAAEIVERLSREGLAYPFHTVVEGTDPERRIAVLSRYPAVEVQHDTASTYRLDGRDVPVQRGFGVCLFEWSNGYRLRLISAHLKSKLFHPLGQTDMRRYEARQLRYLVDAALKAAPEENILIVGDLNDSPDSSPLSTLMARAYSAPKRLYDLRPTDRYGLAWTHDYTAQDVYSRIDYALASYGLVPEVVPAETLLPVLDAAPQASDHRPLVIVIRPRDSAPADALFESYPRNVRRNR